VLQRDTNVGTGDTSVADYDGRRIARHGPADPNRETGSSPSTPGRNVG